MTVARFVFLFFVLLFGGVWTTRVTEAQIQIEDFRPADTSSPRATLVSFLESTQAIAETIRHTKYFDRTSSRFRPITNRALDCLDDSELPEYARTEMLGEAAICLKEILDRVELPPLEDIPDAEAIEAMGGPDELPSWHLPGTRIFITRMTEGPRQHEYLFRREP